MSKPKSAALAKDEVPLPHPAEDLSADDDLLSWILVDQLGCMPNSRLGVHPQENKFVGPVFKTDEVLQIVRETVILGNVPAGMAKLQEFPLIQAHLASKRTDAQRERFIQHLRRYLLCYTPTSRVDIHSTDRYTHVTKHPELAVYATRPLAVGVVLQELQGSVVPLPEEWGAEMDLGDNYELAREAAGQESDESGDEEEEEEEAEQIEAAPRRKGKEVERGQRRSDRTRRRDFSIVWSGLKRCYQLFLGPARFLNHDCSPTVELLRQGNHVTFRVIRAVRIGEELTAYYGDNYFGKDNIECLCLSCEQNQRGHFAPKTDHSRSASEPRSEVSMTPQKPKGRPSNLRREYLDSNSSEASASEVLDAGPSAVPSVGQSTGELEELESDEESDEEPVMRERLSRTAKTNAKPWNFLKRAKPTPSDAESSVIDEDLPDDFPRCGSCTKPLHDRMWYAGRYFDHCARCTRHAFIFGLPWPAHRQSEVQEYPPSHLIPNGYIPRKISTIPLPSLQKKKFKEVLVEVPPDDPIPVSQEYRRQLRLRKEIAMEDFVVQSLRETAWTLQTAKEDAVIAAAAAAEARIEAQRLAREEKKRRDANKIKGSGIWSKYEYVDEEELQRRQDARNAPTNGTRRGRTFKAGDEEEGDVIIVDGPPAAGGSRRIPQVAIPTKAKRKPKPLAKSTTAADPPSSSPTLRLFVGSESGPSRKRQAEPTTGPKRKKPRAESPVPLLLPPYRRSAPMGRTPSQSGSNQSTAETASTASEALRPVETTSESSGPRKRGRPPGSGKHQIAARKAEEQRRLSLSSSAAETSRAGGSPTRPPKIVIAKRGRPWANEPIADDDDDLEEGIEVIVKPPKAVATPTGTGSKSRSDRAKERERASGSSGDKTQSGSSGEKKVRSFFPSRLPILKLGR